MQIQSHRNGGTEATLDGDELATAVDTYLVAHRIYVDGPRTIYVISDGKRALARDVETKVYVDPSGGSSTTEHNSPPHGDP